MQFTFIIPTYNGMPYIKECIESMLSQTYQDFNIVILESKSNDGTAEYLKSINSNEKITILTEDSTPLSIEENFARILESPKSEYMAIVGSDDSFKSNYLAEIVKMIKKYPDCSIYRTHINLIDVNSKFLFAARPIKEKTTVYDYLEGRLRHTYFETLAGYVIRSSDYEKIGGIDCIHRMMHPDDKLVMQLISNSFMPVSSEHAANYRTHPGSESGTPNIKAAIDGYNYFFNWIHSLDDKRLYKIVQNYLPVHLFEIRRFFNNEAMNEQLKMCQTFKTHPKNIYYYVHKVKKNKLYSGPAKFIKKCFSFFKKNKKSICTRRNRINICFASDENYVPYMATTMVSILKNKNKNDDLYFYILCNNVSQESKNKISKLKKISDFSIEFDDIDENVFLELPVFNNHITITMYYRYKIAEVFSQLDKVIYLDCDVIVKQSLSELFKIDIEDYAIGAVEDVGYRYWRNFEETFIHKFDYINSGVLLINLEKWRSNNIGEKLVLATIENKNIIAQGDQDIINLLFQDSCLLLAYKWNVQDSFYRYHCEVENNPNKYKILKAASTPAVIHYTGPKKPWKGRKVICGSSWLYYNLFSPFKEKYLFLKCFSSILRLVKKKYIYSQEKTKTCRIINILGLKFQFKRK